MAETILDLDLNLVQTEITGIINSINSDNYTLTYHRQRASLEFNGEAHLEILGYSFIPTKSMVDLEYDSDPYYKAQDHIFDRVRKMLSDFMHSTEAKYEVKSNNTSEHITWYTKDNDRLTLDLADDSLIITLYLSGQY